MSGAVNSTFLSNLANPPTASPEYWQQQMTNMNALRDYQAKQATAQAYQQSIDPATGQVDQGKFNALLASGPGAWNAGPAMQQVGQAVGAQATAGTQQVARASAVYNMAGSASASLMMDASDENIARIRGGLVTAGAPQPVLDELDRIAAIPDQGQRKQIAFEHNLNMLDAQHRMAIGTGETTGLNVGDRYIPINTRQPSIGPNGQIVPGSISVGAGGSTVSMSPAEAAQPYTYTDSTGKPQSTTVGEHLKSLGVTVQVGGQPIGGPGTSRPASTVPNQPPPPPRGTTVVTPPSQSSTSQPAPNASGVQVGGPPPAPPGAPTGASSAPVSAGQAIPRPAPLPTPPTPPTTVPPPVNTSNAAAAAVAQAKATGRPVPVPGGNGLVAKPDGTVGPLSYNPTGGGVPVASANAMVPSSVGVAAPPSPAVSGDVSAILGGMRGSPANALAGGTATAGPGGGAPAPGWGATSSGQPYIGNYGNAPAAPTTPAPPAPRPATPPVPTTARPASAPPGVSIIGAGGRSLSGPGPGLVPATQETAKASAQMGNNLIARGDQAPVNKANYANMLTDLQRIGNMPAGSEREVAINTFIQKLTGTGLTMTADQIAGANSFAKLANIAIGQQLAAVGGTDARQALFMGSNPNLDLSKLGNTQIIHMLQGNEDAIQAKARAWQTWLQAGNGPDTYGKFQDDFNHHFDPRVFQSQYMAPDEISALRKSMTPGEARAFVDDVRYAREQGWIK